MIEVIGVKEVSIVELKEKVIEFRKIVIIMVYEVQFGYSGGLLFVVDIIIVFYFKEMNIDLKNFKWEDWDCFVLLKGYVVFI